MEAAMPGRILLSAGLLASLTVIPLMAAAQQAGPPGQVAGATAQPEYRPSIADMMNIGVQPRHIKIGLALKAQNWDYLTYETNELRGAFTRIIRTIPRINGQYDTAALIQSMVAAPLQDLADGVKAKDAAKSMSAYAAVTAGCNACHQAVAHAVIVIKAPPTDFFPDQEFQSRAAP
jgi:hypothetical protein